MLAPELRSGDARQVHIHLRRPTAPHNVKCRSEQQAAELHAAVQRHLAAMQRDADQDRELSGGAVEDAGTPAETVR